MPIYVVDQSWCHRKIKHLVDIDKMVVPKLVDIDILCEKHLVDIDKRFIFV